MKRKQLLHIAGLFLLIIFMVVSLSFSIREMKNIRCNNIVVDVNSSDQFVTPDEIEAELKQQVKGLNGCLLDTLNTEAIEKKLIEHPWIKRVEVFKGMDKGEGNLFHGRLHVFVDQREPVMKIVNGTDVFYIDNNGVKIPFSQSATKHVIVVSGYYTDELLANGLMDFVNHINNHKIWKSQLQQIHVLKNEELLLVPRLGRQTIEFGKIDGYETKLRNLMVLYRQEFSKNGWDRYSKISLKYDRQIVCTRK